jgi:propanol-preferring alcohol dehydrogenase
MKAIRITAIGQRLKQENIVAPRPAAGEVRVAVKAAGVCHSDAHYRSGVSAIYRLPITPGHEVAGIIDSVGPGVRRDRVGERVCLHYLVTCGKCRFCRQGKGQFCPEVAMIGKDIDGGYAEYIVVPEQNAFPLPDEIPFTHGAVMMCSFATAMHAFAKARFKEGESVAIFGIGGLGMAAIGIASVLGASEIIAVDRNAAKVSAAGEMGAFGINVTEQDVTEAIMDRTGGRGVDVALELVGLPTTTQQAIRSLGVQGRAAIAGLAHESTAINMYQDLIGKEREVIGVSDHLPGEISELIEMASKGLLEIAPVISRNIPLDEASINSVFDELDRYHGDAVRTVITID